MMVLSDRDWGEEGWTGQTDRQTGLQSDSGQERRGMDRQTDRQADRQTDIQRQTECPKTAKAYYCIFCAIDRARAGAVGILTVLANCGVIWSLTFLANCGVIWSLTLLANCGGRGGVICFKRNFIGDTIKIQRIIMCSSTNYSL